MVDLTAPEIRALLWHIHAVDLGYGSEPPEGSTIDSAKHKLLAELGKPECQGQRGVTLT